MSNYQHQNIILYDKSRMFKASCFLKLKFKITDLNLFEGLLYVVDYIVGILYSHRHTDKIGRYSAFF